ncbi:MAG: serine/threonine protein kinase, partial [Actinomycetota bacterium]|nr:serine/threonine protein kinase [Actinomycetota bacterium]
MPIAGNLGRYQYVSTLGSGGMGTVVLAQDTLLGRQVALKRMHASADVRSLARLRREALLGASVSHPNLVSIYDVLTEEDGELVIVMEYVPGETLAAALDRQRRLAVPEALALLEGVAAGLDAIHRRSIVHRDVKPPNILLSPGGAVKLTDLGIALIPDRTRITSAGAVIGSFRYMAPEQLADAPSSPAIDIYALAAVAFEVLSGRQAQKAPNPMALAHAVSTQPPPDLSAAWPAAPPEAAEVLKRGMSRAPGARPASAGELVRRLRAALVPEDTDEAPPPPMA